MRVSVLGGESLDVGDSPPQSPDISDGKIGRERSSRWLKATQQVRDSDRTTQRPREHRNEAQQGGGAWAAFQPPPHQHTHTFLLLRGDGWAQGGLELTQCHPAILVRTRHQNLSASGLACLGTSRGSCNVGFPVQRCPSLLTAKPGPPREGLI